MVFLMGIGIGMIIGMSIGLMFIFWVATDHPGWKK